MGSVIQYSEAFKLQVLLEIEEGRFEIRSPRRFRASEERMFALPTILRVICCWVSGATLYNFSMQKYLLQNAS